MTTLVFWKRAVERAIKTAAQTAVATIGTTAAIEQVHWQLVGSTAALAAVLSLLTSVGSTKFGDDTPSLVE